MLGEDELKDAVLLVFANKQDLPNAMDAAGKFAVIFFGGFLLTQPDDDESVLM